ncbi:laccase-21-like protein [Carex littledalei]|uniref:Laccase n=1 Tax=Carex littledalei TaxID=544730 RepID=A0A833R3X7_9POAL|nr:laccase-21-like protein [Carex littledalei]
MGLSLVRLGAFLMLFGFIASPAFADTLYHTFVIQEAPYTRLCNNTKNILTVNGSYPGPTLYAHRGDTIFVTVINNGNKNITIHWHGIDQPRDPWSDGPEYITQCPIQVGANFTQRVQITEEEGTVWWHAHSDFDRTTVHGAIVIYPKLKTTYPFPKPDGEFILILGEWWNQDVTQVYETAVLTGADPVPSDANTINGQPGDFAPCSANDTFKVQVEQGKRYLLRVINSAMSNEFFFAVAGHNVTVVGSDGSYTKPYVNEYIMITPGQTFDLLLEANQFLNSSASYRYYIYATPFFDGSTALSRDPNVTVAILEYKTNGTMPSTVPVTTSLPEFFNTTAAAAFIDGLRSLASSEHPVNVPKTIDEHMFITLSVNEVECPKNETCGGIFGTRFGASLNNASFQNPVTLIDVLDAYYSSISGVYTTDFPDRPPVYFNFTADIPFNQSFTSKSTKVKVLEYNTTVEIVFQGTNLLTGENHPMHLHGQSFYVVGRGFGIYDNTTDPLSYNLVDPPFENTVGVPKNGWAAVRFRAANPGVWFMHCHYDRHTLWGMDTVFITKNGNGTNAQIMRPPPNRPPC